MAAVAALAGFEIFANVAASVAPTANFTSIQALNYVVEQKAVSDVTGHPLGGFVVRGSTLPYFSPAGALYVVGDCNGLYLSDGYDYQYTPPQQFEHLTWIPLELDSQPYVVNITVHAPLPRGRSTIPILKVGRTSVWLQLVKAGR